MINGILNIVFFAAFSLNASFLCVSVIEVIFLTGNFNQKFSSTCCAFRMNDYFCLPLLILVVTSNSGIRGGRNTPVFMLTLVFLNFLRFYCLPRSLEVCNLCFFPGTFKFIQGLACGNSHGNSPFSKTP